MDFADATSGNSNSEVHSPDLEISTVRPSFELEYVSFLFCEQTLSPIVTQNVRVPRTCSTERTVEVTPSKRSPAAADELGSTRSDKVGIINTQSSTTRCSRFGLGFYHKHPLQLWQIMCIISRILWSAEQRQDSLQQACN